MMIQRMTPTAQKVEQSTTENHSQIAQVGPNQGKGNVHLTVFQNCYVPVTSLGLQFLIFSLI